MENEVRHYQTAARCVDPDCRCLDRYGVILYRGEDFTEAESAAHEAPTGYDVVVESSVSPPHSLKPVY